MSIPRRTFLHTLAGLCVVPWPIGASVQMSSADEQVLRLYYTRAARQWTEALPVGNGRLGAMVYGGVGLEQLALNEDTLWSGGPSDWNNPSARAALAEVRGLVAAGRFADADRAAAGMLGPYTQSYLPLGTLRLTFDHGDLGRDYERTLDLARGEVSVRYRLGRTVLRRTTIASHPDQVIAIRLESSNPGQLRFTVGLDSALRARAAIDDGALVLTGRAPSHVEPNYEDVPDPVRYDDATGMVWQARVKVVTDAPVTPLSSTLDVREATSATILIAMATSFSHDAGTPRDPVAITRTQLASATAHTWDDLLTRHRDDHGTLFNRLTLDLGSRPAPAAPRVTTDARLAAGAADDPALATLLVQYGRYLLIASSRPGTEPANLQGIWNDQVRAPWSSNYTVNINTEMNYWPAEPGNLAECHLPLLDMVGQLVAPGTETARVNYGAGGWVTHHNTDLWRQTAPVGRFGEGDPVWALWPMGGAWLAQHLWEHFAFGGDRAWLARVAYPAMAGAATFCLDMLVQDADGYLVTSPSTSPEHKFRTAEGALASVNAGVAMDLGIVWDVCTNVSQAASMLGVNDAVTTRIARDLPRLRPYRIDAQGALQEWGVDRPPQDPHHRHFSHLFALHPGRQITRESAPALFAACRQSLVLRGDDGTGWSLAWKINAWARLRDGDRAHRLLVRLLRLVDDSSIRMNNAGGVYANLFDAHPPFQIDGNFGATSGVLEMLVQSHAGAIELLPALPSAWPNGRVHGVRARGGFTLDLDWRDGAIVRAVVRSSLGGVCRLRSRTPLRVDGGASTSRAEGANPNPFYRVYAVTEPLRAADAPSVALAPPAPDLAIDVMTRAGQEIVFVR